MNHPRADDIGNVPLWRCSEAYRCQDCSHGLPHEKEDRCNIRCYRACACVIVGFRVPSRCEDCGQFSGKFYTKPSCLDDCMDMRDYTPRQAGKEGA